MALLLGLIFLGHYRTFAGEGPVMVKEIFFFSLLFGHLVDGEVLKEVHAGFSSCGEVNIAVSIEVFSDNLRSHASGAVHRDRIARKFAGLAVDLVVVDDQRIVGAGVVAGVAAIALAGDQFLIAVAEQIRHYERV